MPDVTVVTPDQVTAWPTADQQEFDRLVAQRQHWKFQEDQAKQCREDYDKRIEAMLLLSVDDVAVRSAQWVVQRVFSKSANKLDAKLLLQQGVSATAIANATVEGKPYCYVLVREAK